MDRPFKIMPRTAGTPRTGRWKILARLAGLAAVCIACAVTWRAGAVQALYWPSLVAHRGQWVAWTGAHPWTAPLAFMSIYALSVAMFLPVGLWLSLLGGLLFGAWAGGVFTVIGAGTGAVVAFFLARGLLAPFFNGRFVEERLGPRIGWLRDGLERDGFSYLLAVRLMPVFPFWLVNLAPALLGMRLTPYTAATFLGLMPASFVLNAVGAGLGASLASGAAPNAAMLLKPSMLLPLLALAVLALLPPLWRARKRQVANPAGPV